MNKKNVLVTGANGQLGSELRFINDKTNRYFYTDIDTLDITIKSKIDEFVKAHKIDIIINCAAYTNVDKAEEEAELANMVNYKAVKNIAEVCQQNDVFLIHISTDYVFNGEKNTPYSEQDQTNPVSVYGRTKLAGEQFIVALGISYIIIRTSWLYSAFGNNFVKTIRRISSQQDTMKVVFDQVGTPTNASDLAELLILIAKKNQFQEINGIYHFSNEGVCSWFDFAKEIVSMSKIDCLISPCLSNEFPSKVVRPNYSVLDKSKLKMDFEYNIPYWKDSLKNVIEKLENK